MKKKVPAISFHSPKVEWRRKNRGDPVWPHHASISDEHPLHECKST